MMVTAKANMASSSRIANLKNERNYAAACSSQQSTSKVANRNSEYLSTHHVCIQARGVQHFLFRDPPENRYPSKETARELR